MLAEQKVCTCGLKMEMSRKVPDAGACRNCDGLQPQEVEFNPETGGNYRRRPSPWDEKFNEVWAERMKEFYPKPDHKGGDSNSGS